jgi:hypothetical protein
MNFLRGRIAYPKDRDLVRVVHAAASRVVEKIENLDVDSLELSLDTRTLLLGQRERVRASIESCAPVFAWSIAKDEKPFSDLTLFAFDDGLGFFSLLAKECNVGTVVYHDRSDILRSDARTVARAIGNEADHYVFGDVEELEFVVRKHSIACDVLVSSGAIDHMGTLRHFLDATSGLSNGPVAFGFALDDVCHSRGVTHSRGITRGTAISRCCEALGQAGFEVTVVRSASGGALGLIPWYVGELLNRTRLFRRGDGLPRGIRAFDSCILWGSRKSPGRPLGSLTAVPSPNDRFVPDEIPVG